MAQVSWVGIMGRPTGYWRSDSPSPYLDFGVSHIRGKHGGSGKKIESSTGYQRVLVDWPRMYHLICPQSPTFSDPLYSFQRAPSTVWYAILVSMGTLSALFVGLFNPLVAQSFPGSLCREDRRPVPNPLPALSSACCCLETKLVWTCAFVAQISSY